MKKEAHVYIKSSKICPSFVIEADEAKTNGKILMLYLDGNISYIFNVDELSYIEFKECEQNEKKA